MSIVCGYLRRAMLVVCCTGSVLGLSGLYGSVWAGADSSPQPSQDSPAASSESSGSAGTGSEERGRGRHAGRKACAEDAKKLCSGVKPGEGRIMQCLKAHAQELSPTCAETMQQRGKNRP